MMKTVPLDVIQVLLKVQEFDLNAIIVGGFLRDLYHGKEPKDVDIIVNSNIDPLHICNKFDGQDYNCDSIESELQNANDVNFSFEATFTIPNISWPINIIGTRPGQSPLEKLKSHDFGLCQIWYDGLVIKTTEAYDYDAYHHCMTLQRCNSLEEWQAVLTHYFRVARKYSYPMRIPHEKMDHIFGKGFPDDLIPF